MVDVLHRNSSWVPLYAAQPLDSNRRNFLMFGTSVAGAAVAMSVLGAPAAIVESAESKPESQGYQETEHVRRYYATTRL